MPPALALLAMALVMVMAMVTAVVAGVAVAHERYGGRAA